MTSRENDLKSDHLFTQHPHYVWYFSLYVIERSVLMTLVFYYEDMLEKITMQRAHQFSAFFLVTERTGERIQVNAARA